MRADPYAPFGGAAPIDPARLEGVLTRRVFALVIDLCVIGLLWLIVGLFSGVLAILSFGLLSGGFLLLPILGPCYHALTIGLGGATWGQRILGLEVRDLQGRPPTLLQAIVQTAVFYLTVVPTGGLVLLLVFVFERKRTLHDWVAGLQVLRRLEGHELLVPRGRA